VVGLWRESGARYSGAAQLLRADKRLEGVRHRIVEGPSVAVPAHRVRDLDRSPPDRWPRLLEVEELANGREADRGDRTARMVADRGTYAADTEHRFLPVDGISSTTRLGQIGEQLLRGRDREAGRARKAETADDDGNGLIIESREERLAETCAAERTAGARARVSADVACVAKDLVDVQELPPIRNDEEGCVIRGADEQLSAARVGRRR
jgi:hypothetical protein